jgi:hypothetical protein
MALDDLASNWMELKKDEALSDHHDRGQAVNVALTNQLMHFR